MQAVVTCKLCLWSCRYIPIPRHKSITLGSLSGLRLVLSVWCLVCGNARLCWGAAAVLAWAPYCGPFTFQCSFSRALVVQAAGGVRRAFSPSYVFPAWNACCNVPARRQTLPRATSGAPALRSAAAPQPSRLFLFLLLDKRIRAAWVCWVDKCSLLCRRRLGCQHRLWSARVQESCGTPWVAEVSFDTPKVALPCQPAGRS